MEYIFIYLIIGQLVSGYMVWYYRLSTRARIEATPTRNDAMAALIGQWIWPLQIIKHLWDLKRKTASQR